MARAASVRFYVDADILGLGKLLATVRPDVTYPGDPGGTLHKQSRPPCPVTTAAAPDTEWIPVAAEHGWLIITRDRHIQERRGERDAVRETGARMIALAGKEARNTFAQLEVLMCNWRWVGQLLERDGPSSTPSPAPGLPARSLSTSESSDHPIR